MAFNFGILSGMANRARERRQEDIAERDRETTRNQNLLTNAANVYLKLAENPDTTDEARNIFLQRGLQASTHPPDKKPPKELFDFSAILEGVQPKMGQSWLGGQTERQVQATPMPIQSNLSEPGVADTRRQPEATDFTIPMPQPPTGTTRSPYLSRAEKEAGAERTYRRQQGIQTEELIKRERAQAQARQEFAPPSVPDPFTLSPGQKRFDPQGNLIAESAAASPSDNSLTETELAMKAASGDPLAMKAWELILQTKQQLRPEQAEAGQYLPLMDARGTIIGAWNPKSGTYVPAPIEGARRGGVTASVNETVRDAENSVRKIAELATAYKPEFVGPVEGRLESSKASGILSYLPFFKTIDGYGEFLALNADLKNSIIKLITGAQMGIQEADRILKQVPVETDKDEIWKAKFIQTQKNAQFLLDRTRELNALVPGVQSPDGVAGGPNANANDTVRVQLPGQPPGRIPRSALPQFLADNPGATEIQ